jgi:hypothetical protein
MKGPGRQEVVKTGNERRIGSSGQPVTPIAAAAGSTLLKRTFQAAVAAPATRGPLTPVVRDGSTLFSKQHQLSET